MKNAYVIIGEAGAYADYSSWAVAVFLDYQVCSEHVKKLNQFLIENKNKARQGIAITSPLDPQMDLQKFDNEYRIETVELFE
jgi:hypothetical protein